MLFRSSQTEVNWEGATRSMKGVQLDKNGEYGSTKKDEY